GILVPANSANQILPSAPAVMPRGSLFPVGIGNSEITPLGVILPILLPLNSVSHRFPSGPAAIIQGWLLAVGGANSAIGGPAASMTQLDKTNTARSVTRPQVAERATVLIGKGLPIGQLLSDTSDTPNHRITPRFANEPTHHEAPCCRTAQPCCAEV